MILDPIVVYVDEFDAPDDLLANESAGCAVNVRPDERRANSGSVFSASGYPE